MWVLLWVDVGDTAGADEWSLHVAELEALDVRKSLDHEVGYYLVIAENDSDLKISQVLDL